MSFIISRPLDTTISSHTHNSLENRAANIDGLISQMEKGVFKEVYDELISAPKLKSGNLRIRSWIGDTLHKMDIQMLLLLAGVPDKELQPRLGNLIDSKEQGKYLKSTIIYSLLPKDLSDHSLGDVFELMYAGRFRANYLESIKGVTKVQFEIVKSIDVMSGIRIALQKSVTHCEAEKEKVLTTMNKSDRSVVDEMSSLEIEQFNENLIEANYMAKIEDDTPKSDDNLDTNIPDFTKELDELLSKSKSYKRVKAASHYRHESKGHEDSGSDQEKYTAWTRAIEKEDVSGCGHGSIESG